MVAKCFPLLIVNTAVCCEKVNEVHFMKEKKKKMEFSFHALTWNPV